MKGLKKQSIKIMLLSLLCGLSATVMAASPTQETSSTDINIGKNRELVEFALEQRNKHVGISENSVTRLAFHVDIDIFDDIVNYRFREVWHYPNQASVQDYGYETIHYDAASETLQQISALTIHADGSEFWFDNDDIQVLESDTYNVFTDQKEVIVNYPGLSSDSISVLEYIKSQELSRLELSWSDIFYLRSTRNQGELKFTININSKNDIFHFEDSEYVDCNREQNQIVCFAENVPALKRDKNWLFRDQTDNLVLSALDSWEDVKAQINQGFDEARKSNRGVKQVVENLVTNEMSVEQKISKVHQFVARDIRYVSVSEANNAYTPHSIARTLDKKYGDCKDKTALLLEMMSILGVQAYPVLVSTTRQNAEKLVLPSGVYFNHVVLCFDLVGTEKCIDATDSTSDWRYTSNWILGDLSLPLVDQAKPQNIHQMAYPWQIQNDITLEFLEDGSQKEWQQINFDKSYASAYRAQLETKSGTEREKWASDLYQSAVAENQTPQLEISGIESIEQAIAIKTQTTFTDYVESAPSFSLTEYEPWIRYELDSINLENEVYAQHVPGSQVSSKVKVVMPETWSVQSLPANLNLKTEFMSLKRDIVKKEDGSFMVTTVFEMPSVTLEVDQFEYFEKIVALFKNQSQIRFSGLVED